MAAMRRSSFAPVRNEFRLLIDGRPHAHHDRVAPFEQTQHEVLRGNDQLRLGVGPWVEDHVSPKEVRDHGEARCGLDADSSGTADRLALKERLARGQRIRRAYLLTALRERGDLQRDSFFVVLANLDLAQTGPRLSARSDRNEPAPVARPRDGGLRADQRTAAAAAEDDGEPLILDHHIVAQGGAVAPGLTRCQLCFWPKSTSPLSLNRAACPTGRYPRRDPPLQPATCPTPARREAQPTDIEQECGPRCIWWSTLTVSCPFT